MACDSHWLPESPLLSKEGQGEVAVWSLAQYADPIARELLCAWKYQFDRSAWATLRRRLTPSLSLIKLKAAIAHVDAIVPVPLHYQRKAWRGFDQAEEIAAWLGASLNIPVRKLLKRKLTFGHQADKTDADRLASMQKSPFVIPSNTKDLPQNILLVDDVWTTGATMNAAASVLTAKNITVQPFTIAKS